MRWTTDGIRRVRRRARRPPDGVPLPVERNADEGVDIELTIPRSRLEAFLAELTGSGLSRKGPPSPATLTAAVAAAIDRAGGQGRPSVTRSPAGVYTPEFWRFRVEAADGHARALLDRAGRVGRVR